jgi:hypothetical protein
VNSNLDEIQVLNIVHCYALKVSTLESSWSGLEMICEE